VVSQRVVSQRRFLGVGASKRQLASAPAVPIWSGLGYDDDNGDGPAAPPDQQQPADPIVLPAPEMASANPLAAHPREERVGSASTAATVNTSGGIPLAPPLHQSQSRRTTASSNTLSTHAQALTLQRQKKKEQAVERRRQKVIGLNMTTAKVASVQCWMDNSDQGLSSQLGKLTDPDDYAATVRREAQEAKFRTIPTFAQSVVLAVRLHLAKAMRPQRLSTSTLETSHNDSMGTLTASEQSRTMHAAASACDPASGSRSHQQLSSQLTLDDELEEHRSISMAT
jgi:hypothetical protein